MSLLLDALKKAADDKEKKSRAGLASQEEVSLSADDAVKPLSEAPDLQPENLSIDITDKPTVDDAGEIEDIELEELSLDELDQGQYGDEDRNDMEEDKQQDDDAVVTTEEKNYRHEERSDESAFVISDEALSMLIYKTNKNVKQSKRVLISGVLLVSFLILISGGIYYYMDMEAEIEMLERKHQIAMQTMRSRTNKEKTPDKSEIIRNLVSDTDLEEKVKYAKQHMESEQSKKQLSSIKKPAKKKQVNENNEVAGLSIKRTKKADPVGEKLDDAWLAYENANYIEAKQLYKDVLLSESNNRDALLGLGAIAVLEKDQTTARKVYLILLDLDPRDPVATAALAGMHNDQSTASSDKEYLISLLAKNPEAPHLNFALGNVYAQLNKWSQAQEYYFNAWQYDNGNADYLFNLAVSMDQLGKQKQAVDFYKDSLLKASDKQVSFSREAVQKRIDEITRL
ncbi:MAG: tetratricopeptide repeat protein [Gammaproteobacteria bacterium]|nr:tetratricopeptide repeat protein [Gammaproteobacteria bacterium]